jgi:hypothetical protein
LHPIGAGVPRHIGGRNDLPLLDESGEAALQVGIVGEELEARPGSGPHDHDAGPGVEKVPVQVEVEVDLRAAIKAKPGPRLDVASAEAEVLNVAAKEERQVVDDDLGCAVAVESLLPPALSAFGFFRSVLCNASWFGHSETPYRDTAFLLAGVRRPSDMKRL